MLRKSLFTLLFLTSFQNCNTREIKLEELNSLKGATLKIRASNFKALEKSIIEDKKLNYLQSFLLGLEYKKQRKYKTAILWFTQAFYEDDERLSKKFYPSSVYNYVTSWKKKI